MYPHTGKLNMFQDLSLEIMEFHQIDKLKQLLSDLISSSRMTNRFSHTCQLLLVGRDLDTVLRRILRSYPRENMFGLISNQQCICISTKIWANCHNL